LRLGARLTTLISFMIGVRLKISGHYRIRRMSIQDVMAGRILLMELLRLLSFYSIFIIKFA